MKAADPQTAPVLLSVLQPYSESIQARLDALQGTYDSVSALVENINRFYTYKRVEFSLQTGLTIQDDMGKSLAPFLLSSGERQLLLLFANTVVSQDQARIFIIDEPELSLNVKWQRDLVGALLDCARGGNVQFLFATHSLELLARHRACVAKLQNRPSH